MSQTLRLAGKNIWKIKCMFWSFLQILSEIFLILKRYEWAVIINTQRSSFEVPLVLSYFNETWIFSTDFQKVLKYQLSRKSVMWAPSFSMRTDRQTDGKWTDKQTENGETDRRKMYKQTERQTEKGPTDRRKMDRQTDRKWAEKQSWRSW